MLLSMVDLGRRIRAARELAGMRNVEALAERVDEPGLGVSTLRAIEQGRREARNMELRAIAEACGVPYSFFTTDTADLGASGSRALDAKLATMDERLETIERLLRRHSNYLGLILNYYAAAGERTDPTAAQALDAMQEFADDLPALLDIPKPTPATQPDPPRAKTRRSATGS